MAEYNKFEKVIVDGTLTKHLRIKLFWSWKLSLLQNNYANLLPVAFLYVCLHMSLDILHELKLFVQKI